MGLSRGKTPLGVAHHSRRGCRTHQKDRPAAVTERCLGLTAGKHRQCARATVLTFRGRRLSIGSGDGSCARNLASRALRLRSPRDTPLALPTNVLLLRWDTKPDKRIRRTFLRLEPTRRTSFYAATGARQVRQCGLSSTRLHDYAVHAVDDERLPIVQGTVRGPLGSISRDHMLDGGRLGVAR
jgi:hypothetical protein